MATGLIGEKAGSQRRGPRQPRRSDPGQLTRPGRPSGPGQRAEPGQLHPGIHHPGPFERGRPQPGKPRTLQPVRPAGQPGPQEGRPATRPLAGRSAAARPQARSRTPFVLLLVGLLAGGLVCLLLINTTLAEGAFQITAMQHKNTALSQQEQALQQQVTAAEAPASIAARAQQLGMRPAGRLRFIDLKKGRVYSQPATEPGVVTVPGYTP